eukprot:g6333.t1
MTRRGVSLEFLRQWTMYKELEGSHMTTAEVCAQLIKPVTREEECSYFELIEDECSNEDDLWCGRASYFLSHTWSYRFVELIDILEAFEEALPADAKRVYYWFDIFVMNQHSKVQLGPQLTNNLQSAVSGAGKLLMALDSWSAPSPLSRAWCLLEIFSAIMADCDISMCMSENQQGTFVHNLDTNQGALEEIILNLDAEQADATVEADKAAIFDQIRAGVGFDRFNDEIRAALRASLRRIVLRFTLMRQNARGTIARRKSNMGTGTAVGMKSAAHAALAVSGAKGQTPKSSASKEEDDTPTPLHRASKRFSKSHCVPKKRKSMVYPLRRISSEGKKTGAARASFSVGEPVSAT